jgi:hypothetical protein
MVSHARTLEGSFPLMATRECCKACNRISAVGFWVPNKVWLASVPKHLQNGILCVSCFVTHADERLVPWDAEIQFYPVSLRTHLGDLLTGD